MIQAAIYSRKDPPKKEGREKKEKKESKRERREKMIANCVT